LIAYLKSSLRPYFYKYYEYFHAIRALEWHSLGKWLHPAKGERILDLACGHGHFVRRAHRSGVKIFGIDTSRSGIRIAQQYNRPRGCGYAMADALDLPFCDAVFDKIISVCALEHFADDTTAVKEASRVLKVDGRLILSVDSLNHHGVTPRFRQRCKVEHFVNQFYTKEQLQQTLERAGFEILKIKYIVNTALSSLTYRIGCYFRWRGIDFMDFIIAICLLPACFILENILNAGSKEEGYIIVVEALKVK
jgi:ubiquinone/menaquinone biosynthesis C-methylase UbiE